MALSAAILFSFLKTQFIFVLPVLTAFSLDGRGLEKIRSSDQSSYKTTAILFTALAPFFPI
jgi:hypothetical protein